MNWINCSWWAFHTWLHVYLEPNYFNFILIRCRKGAFSASNSIFLRLLFIVWIMFFLLDSYDFPYLIWINTISFQLNIRWIIVFLFTFRFLFGFSIQSKIDLYFTEIYHSLLKMKVELLAIAKNNQLLLGGNRIATRLRKGNRMSSSLV